MSFDRGIDKENVVHLQNRVLSRYLKGCIHEILKQMDGTRKYHLGWGNPITKEHTWYAQTDKWILAHKLQITKIQFTDHMKFKKEDQSVGTSVLFRRTKYLQEQIWRLSVEERPKDRPSRDCPTWRLIPYTVTKPRHYCGCQQVHAERSLIMAVSWEALSEP